MNRCLNNISVILCNAWTILAIERRLVPEREYNYYRLERKSVPNTEIESKLMILKVRAKSALPAQIGGIVGAYLISVCIVCAVVRILAWRLRKRSKLLSGVDLDKENVERQFRENLSEHISIPTISGGMLDRQKKSVKQSKQTVHPIPPTFDPPANLNHSGQSFDLRVLEADRETLSQDLKNFYAYVMAQEDLKAAGVDVTAQSPQRVTISREGSFHGKLDHEKKNKQKVQFGLPKLKAPEKVVTRISNFLTQLKSSRENPSSIRHLQISYPTFLSSTGFSPLFNESIRGPLAPRVLPAENQSKISESSFFTDSPLNPADVLASSTIKLSNPSWSYLSQSSTQFLGRSLPLREFESHAQFSSSTVPATKTTILERKDRYYGHETGGLSVLWSAGPVPYSPYEPGSMMMQVSPMLITKEERKRRKRLEPKTPVFEMVKSDHELWDDAYQ